RSCKTSCTPPATTSEPSSCYGCFKTECKVWIPAPISLSGPGPRGQEVWMEKIDDGLKALLESGKEKGYLTFTQVNDYLPDDAVNPEKLDQLLLLLEEQGIELIDESEADEREQGTSREEDDRADLDFAALIDEEDSRRIDDPVRMYLTQMGEIPL